jgi:hypothetical protein
MSRQTLHDSLARLQRDIWRDYLDAHGGLALHMPDELRASLRERVNRPGGTCQDDSSDAAWLTMCIALHYDVFDEARSAIDLTLHDELSLANVPRMVLCACSVGNQANQ